MPIFTQRRALILSVSAQLMLAACSKTPLPEATPTPAAQVETADLEVTSNVTTALLRDAQLKDLNITVVTLKGDVRLTGVVQTQAQIERALVVARAAEGTHAIHDELTLQK